MSTENLEAALLQANELAVGTLESEARLQAILASVGDAVLTVDADGGIESANLAAERLFGQPVQQLLGRLITELIPELQPDRRVVAETREAQARRLDGVGIPIELTLSRVELPNGDLLLAVARDISERKAATAELERLAGTDSLTGLANRYRGTREFEHLLLLAERQHQPLAVSILDMDHFKRLNDEHGHPTGDEVLRQLGAVLLAGFRKTDVVARWGGEEFLIGLYNSPKLEATLRLERVQKELGDQIAAMLGSSLQATFSAGVAEFPSDGQSLEELYRAADSALYLAKTAGRACVLPTP